MCARPHRRSIATGRRSPWDAAYEGTPLAVLLHDLRHFLRPHVLDEVIVHEYGCREAAGAEAFDLDDGPFAVGTRRAGIASPRLREERLQHVLGAADVAGRRRAHLHEVF